MTLHRKTRMTIHRKTRVTILRKTRVTIHRQTRGTRGDPLLSQSVSQLVAKAVVGQPCGSKKILTCDMEEQK